MKRLLVAVMLIIFPVIGFAASGLGLRPGETGVSLKAVTATGRGDCFQLGLDGYGRPATGFNLTVTTTGSPTSYTVLLEGAEKVDGSDAITLGTITQATAQTIYVNNVFPSNICANLSVLSGGTSPTVTATIKPVASTATLDLAFPGVLPNGSNGLTSTGAISAPQFTVTTAPTNPTDAATKRYSDRFTYPTGLAVFGDSNSCGVYASGQGANSTTTTHSFAALLGADIGGAFTNNCSGGRDWVDLVGITTPNVWGLPYPRVQNSLYVLGTNAIALYGSDADKQKSWKDIVRANLILAAQTLDDQNYNGYYRGAAAMTCTGTWSTDYGQKSSTVGDTCTGTINVKKGSLCVVRWIADTYAGSGDILIDNVVVDTLPSTGYAGKAIANVSSQSPAATCYSVANGSRSVTVRVASGTFNIYALVSPVDSYGGISPMVWVGGVIKQKDDANAALTKAYDDMEQEVVKGLQGYGYGNVNFIYGPDGTSCRNSVYLPSATMYNDALHLKQAGHSAFADCLAYGMRIPQLRRSSNVPQFYASVTTTAAATDTLKVRGAETTSKCYVMPGDTSATTTTMWQSNVGCSITAQGLATITHPVTAGAVFDLYIIYKP